MTSDELKRLRTQTGETQAAMAARLGTTTATISRWENGERAIPEAAARLIRITHAARQQQEKDVDRKRATPKVMKLIDPSTGLMECKVCGAVHRANVKAGGRYYRGAWQCQNGCELTTKSNG